MRFGWLPQIPDQRDLMVADVAPKAVNAGPGGMALPGVDLRETGLFSPVEDQLSLGSCTAQACAGAIEFTQRHRFGNHLDCSRLFLYRAARKLLFKVSGAGRIGDTGATLRESFKVMSGLGVPPEWAWPYDVDKFDDEPPPDVYAWAAAFQALYYVSAKSLAEVKALLRNEIPVCFGFSVYESIGEADATGHIPVPEPGERLVGGHAVVAVGYQDEMERVIIRNSWGRGWGEAGYGFLPYWYFESGLTSDYWALLLAEWVDL